MTVIEAPSPAGPSLTVTALSFTEPLPGFPRFRAYALVPAATDGLLYWLQSVEPEGPRFLAVPAAPYFPDYTPRLSGAVRWELQLDDDAPAVLYCLVSVPRGDVRTATANLRAPLAVNPARGLARQVVLADASHPIRRPMRR